MRPNIEAIKAGVQEADVSALIAYIEEMEHEALERFTGKSVPHGPNIYELANEVPNWATRPQQQDFNKMWLRYLKCSRAWYTMLEKHNNEINPLFDAVLAANIAVEAWITEHRPTPLQPQKS